MESTKAITMNNKIENKENTSQKAWIKYAIYAVIAIVLYTTGYYKDIMGFAQRGMLATGLLNPNVEEITSERNSENSNSAAIAAENPADLSLKLMDRNGKIVTLEDLKGKVIFMNFWATWCPPCIAEMPSIDKLHEDMGKDVEFVMLSLDDDFEKAKQFDDKKGYDLPIYTLAGELPAMYQSSAIPTTYIIDAKGNLALTHKGMADYSDPEIKKFLESLK